MKNITIGKRLIIVFGLVSLLTLILGGVVFQSLWHIENQWNSFYNISIKKSELVNNSTNHLGNGVQAFKNYILRGKEYHTEFEKEMVQIENSIIQYTVLGHISDEEKISLSKITEGISAYRTSMEKAVVMKKAGESIEKIDSSIKGADKPIKISLQQLDKVISGNTQNTALVFESEISNTKKTTVLLGLISIFSTALLAYFTTKSITTPIKQAVDMTNFVANGDLTHDIKIEYNDETGQMLHALKNMSMKLNSIISNVRNSTDVIVVSSAEISVGNNDLSRRTETQAGSLEEIAAAIEQLTSSVKQNADNAGEANKLSVIASNVATNGGDVVNNVVNKMAIIKESSKKITEIISVIDGIAFQTNILALNAAVEAARAGEQGRGFAVVASEVRSLAQRSANAAKEIKQLIYDSNTNIDEGGQLVTDAGKVMKEIVSSIKNVSSIVNEISYASKEQSLGIEAINQSISEIDEITQQNAALVEEAAAASMSMSEQSKQLLQSVEYFKTNK